MVKRREAPKVLRAPDDLWHEFRMTARKEGMTLQDFLRTLLQIWAKR